MPPYPIEAARQDQQGTVILDVTINAQGQVIKVVIERSSGYRILDMAAEKAAHDWKFNPGIKDGKPVGGVVRVPVNFSMNG